MRLGTGVTALSFLGTPRSNVQTWEGTAQQLLVALTDSVTEVTRRAKDWPKTPRGLAGALRRLAPNLRAVGISVEFDRQTDKSRARKIKITLLEQAREQPSETQQNQGSSSDGTDGAATAADGRPSEPDSNDFKHLDKASDGTDGQIPLRSNSDSLAEYEEI